MEVVRFIFLMFLLVVSCTPNNSNIKPGIQNSKDSLKAIGVLMNADTIKPPIVITAGPAKITKPGIPKVKLFKPHVGDAWGMAYMQSYTTDQGLALDAISKGDKSSICDKKGNLWFGTYGGVSRYDGKSFTNFSTKHGLPNNDIESITEDKNGNFWFGTYGGGVSCYNGRSFTNFDTRHGLASDFVFSGIEDKNGNLWFGTNGGGVSRYNGKTFTNFTTAQGLANNSVNSVIEDKNGNFWFGTEGGGVSRYDGKTFTNFTTAQGLANNKVSSITEDGNGNIWFGTVGGGVSCYNGKSFTNFTTVQGLPSNFIKNITKDKNGNLWFVTYYDGISRYDGKTFNNYTTEQGLPNNDIQTITEDKTGNLWFSTYGSGICRYDGKSFINFTTKQGLSGNIIYCITEDKNGKLWFGTDDGGVCRYDEKSFANFTTKQGLLDNNIMSVAEDRKGNLWFGSQTAGVSRYDGKTFAVFDTTHGLPHVDVECITEDKNGNLWFGTNGGGASRYDGKTFTNFTTAQGLASNFVYNITEDKHGNLWFGTNGDGVSRYDGKFFTNFTKAQGLADNVVLSSTEDPAGNLWFGTVQGASRYDGKSFTNYTTGQGLPDNVVTQLIVTQEGNIAVATNLGLGIIVAFNKTPGTKATQNKIPAINNLSNSELKAYEPIIEIYNSATGYPLKDVNSGGHCMFLDSKGKIWLATGSDKTALVRFDYGALNRTTDPPVVMLQNIRVNEETICWYNLDAVKNDSVTKAQQEIIAFGKSLSEQDRETEKQRYAKIKFDGITKFYPLPEDLTLPYDHNHIGFEFAAIEPARPYLVKFQYFLQGYDKEWSPLTNKTEVSFGNMYEGTYTFKLKARSPFGVWSEPLTYTFKVLPPWWRTWWMYTVYGIITVALVSVIVWLNARRLRRRAKELKQKVIEATEEIIAQKQLVEEKHKEITDSITYAERIQRALLASKNLLDENLNDYFILFKPKDIVSGDFYWATKSDSSFVLVTADSTGHGVPGAIMSIVNIASLKEASLRSITSPDLLLNETRRLVIENLKNDGSAEGGKDGMDGSLLSFDFKNNILNCSSANNPVWIVRTGSIIEIKADRFPIGKHDKDQVPFTLQTINLQKGDVVYSLTDGFPDQFGGTYGKKFKYKQLQQLLLSISNESMQAQKQKLSDVFEEWKGSLEQVDDVCLIGVRV